MTDLIMMYILQKDLAVPCECLLVRVWVDASLLLKDFPPEWSQSTYTTVIGSHGLVKSCTSKLLQIGVQFEPSFHCLRYAKVHVHVMLYARWR